MDASDSLVQRRSRRSTAGNRMEAVLAEMHAEDAALDGDDDNDFVLDARTDQQDVFGSDFESTDDEANQDGLETSDKTVRDDERRERMEARARAERAVKAAASRQRVTFNPDAATEDTSTPLEREKKQRRVSLGVAFNAETGEVLSGKRRQSGRALTQAARTASLQRIAEEEKLKSATPKKAKVKQKRPTQGELINRALNMEEGNIRAHRNYLKIEEENRRRAHVERVAVNGPLVRWVSRLEQEEVFPDPEVETPAPESSGTVEISRTQPLVGTLTGSLTSYSAVPVSSALNTNSSASYATPVQAHSQPPGTAQTELRVVTAPRQYVVHEASQERDARLPPWKDTMGALFGTHVAWDKLRVYTSSRNRPFSRYIPNCPITGAPGIYRDPRTGVPFSNVEAYSVLTKVLAHEYVWSPLLGCYTSVSPSLLDDEDVVMDEEKTTGGERNKGKARA